MTVNIPDQKDLIKYGVIAVVALIVIVAVIFSWKKIKKFFSNGMTELQQEHITSLEINEDEVQLPQTEMQNLVAKLKTAFGSWGWGTDEDAVYSVFESLNNRSELLSLIQAFGVYEDHTLGEWISKELNDEEIEHIQNILSSKGIVYSF